jgi:hypothetical protein
MMLTPTLLLVCSLLSPFGLRAEYYRYVTDEGQIHYVDDLTRVPEKYLDRIKTYQDIYDHLSEEERALTLQRDRERDRQRALLEDKLILQQDRERDRQQRLQQDKLLEQQEKQQLEPKPYETSVVIHGNQVLVPLTVGHDNRSDEALFLLDTGATHLVIFKDFASRFNIKAVTRGYSKVAGGALIPTERAILDYIKVGPLRVENTEATIIKNIKSGGREFEFSGLLGIEILRHIEYTIDFENQKIRWKPKS